MKLSTPQRELLDWLNKPNAKGVYSYHGNRVAVGSAMFEMSTANSLLARKLVHVEWSPFEVTITPAGIDVLKEVR